MKGSPPVVFALAASRAFGERVAERLGVAPGAHEEREFEDGEHKARPLENVRNRDVYVVQSLYTDDAASVNDKLIRLLFFLGALRDAAAARVTAVVPYLAYARKDRKSQPRDPVSTRYVAALFEAVGVDRLMTLDVHNVAAFQNAFRCRTEHLEGHGLFVDYLAPALRGDAPVAVVSPDIGGVKRAERLRAAFAHALGREVPLGFFDKGRAKGVLSYGRLSGDVAGCDVVLIDDLISTGGTLLHAARACRDAGARSLRALATHGVFTGAANAALADAAFDEIVVTDTIVPFRLDSELLRRKVTVRSAAGLFAEAIRRVHDGGSIVDLLSV
jgi:ribose-phosphate pyrophosphokinase